MEEKNPRKARWSILFFAAMLVMGSLGLAGCPDDDDDDIFKAPANVVQAEAPGIVE